MFAHAREDRCQLPIANYPSLIAYRPCKKPISFFRSFCLCFCLFSPSRYRPPSLFLFVVRLTHVLLCACYCVWDIWFFHRQSVVVFSLCLFCSLFLLLSFRTTSRREMHGNRCNFAMNSKFTMFDEIAETKSIICLRDDESTTRSTGYVCVCVRGSRV